MVSKKEIKYIKSVNGSNLLLLTVFLWSAEVFNEGFIRKMKILNIGLAKKCQFSKSHIIVIMVIIISEY